MSDIALECKHCGAELVDGLCEYCGSVNGNSRPEVIDEKTLVLKGVFNQLTLTKQNCTIKPVIGRASVIKNKEISDIAFTPARVFGEGELRIETVTGVAKRVAFLYPQNLRMEEIASYLLYVAPNAAFSKIDTANTLKTADEPLRAPRPAGIRDGIKQRPKLLYFIWITLALYGVYSNIPALFVIGAVCLIFTIRASKRPKHKKIVINNGGKHGK